jgi:hypothetical protein
MYAKFAAKIQDGISLLVKTQRLRGQQTDFQLTSAFENFKTGFDLIRSILANVHPMSLALVLSVLCEAVPIFFHTTTFLASRG